MPEQSWIAAQDLYDQGYTVDGARQLFGEPKTSPDGTLGWEDDWIDRAEGRALIPVLPFLIERLRGHSEVGEAAGELVRLYEELNRRVGTDGAPDPLHHHEISEDELVELGNDRDALNAIYGSPHRWTQEPVVEGNPVPFISQERSRFGDGARLAGRRNLRWWLKSAVGEVANKQSENA
ncbi:hypothetical protein [Rhodococcus sp. IEGM 1307]|uniref:hypothetical protein n=1 Tax=Rhodococcus sp. IEGM 1307 TaxID=3047091 RepID=UPI0024B65A55|nr:hypothetical protein [Rhodococcus sp. IEGM 1307]MDI9979487.1 hypothetical protein [Rhodococcus sp. IEGM 1307]